VVPKGIVPLPKSIAPVGAPGPVGKPTGTPDTTGVVETTVAKVAAVIGTAVGLGAGLNTGAGLLLELPHPLYAIAQATSDPTKRDCLNFTVVPY
jgi:hypothetical protein